VEASICSDLYSLGSSWAPKFGLSLVYRGQASIVQPDYTSSCQAAASAGAQILYLGLDASSVLRALQSCLSINYRPIFLTASSSASPVLPQQAHSDGTVVGMVALPNVVAGNAAVTEFQATLKRFAPSVQPSVPAITGWVAAKLFELAIQNVAEPPTNSGVLNGLWAIKGNDLGGLTGPLTFAKGQNAPRTLCYWVMEVSQGAFISPDGGTRKCIAP
jgi:branched-chain amino acid transport system substrate-binding protein